MCSIVGGGGGGEGKKSGAGGGRRRKGGEEGDTYLDGHVETNMATSSKDRYTFRT